MVPPKKQTPKKAKPSSSTTQQALPKREALLKWFKDQKISYNPNLMTIHYNSDIDEFHITANKVALKPEAILGSIPKVSCLSVKNCAIADLIDEADFVGTLALTLALLFERTHNLAHPDRPSPWTPYLNSLPQRAPTPLFWSDQNLSLLSQTDTPATIYKTSLRSDFDTLILPFLVKNPSLFPPTLRSTEEYWQDFQDASSIVTSRAFAIDTFHGDALVPLADLFNHKSGAEHVHIQGDGDVCVFCGAVEGGCDCLWSDDEEEGEHEHDHEGGCCGGDEGHEHGEEEEDDDEMTEEELSGLSIKELKTILKQIGVDSSDCLYKKDLVAKLLENYNESKNEKGRKGGKQKEDEEDEEEEWEDEDGSDDEEHDDEWLFKLEEPIPDLVDTAGGKKKKGGNNKPAPPRYNIQDEDQEQEVEDSLEISIVRPVKPNGEIYNIYGDHTNAKLLNLYGFAEQDNPNNTVKVNIEYLLETLKDIVGERVLFERLGFWREVGHKVVDFTLRGEDDEEEEEDDEDWEEDEHEHGDDCSHDHDHDHESKKKEPKDVLKDTESFHFNNSGEASKELISFLHLVLLDGKAFQLFTKDEESIKKYITHIVETGLEAWVATPASGGKKKASPVKASPVKATEKPVFHQIHAILNASASQRFSAYEGTDGVEELKQLEELIKLKDYSPRRWALTVRTEERRILHAALLKYRK
ncbi:UNVERIFIED_CONTAM: hypothetical protein HDU68_009691 [Siphonaria sp. JEL0065]|nr:hypothetical protein HDU68_009691 [Siphonaria sp. JEL0065]